MTLLSTVRSEDSSRPRRRRTSNGLPGDPRGDTGAAALSTMSEKSPERVPAASPQPHADGTKRHSKRRKAKTLFRRWKSFCFRNTWFIPLIVCLAVLSAYAYSPGTQNPFHSAIFLSYPMPRTPGADASTPIQYDKGSRDLAFVAFYTVVLSFTREFLMQRLIRPLAIRVGIRSRAKQARFMEQCYTAIYFGFFGPFGLYVMSRSPMWYFNTTAMFEGFPHRLHEGLFKAYYLLQASYWAQQAIVLMLQLEKPRKDFKELVGHHIITIALIWLSYRFHFTYMGLAVYITHDISDFFLATSKTLNYVDSIIVVPYFGLFVFAWAYLRHYLNIRLLVAVLTEFRTVGPYELNWGAEQYKCWISQVIAFVLLASLQAVNLFWFWLIVKIARRYVLSNVVEDERSEADEDDADESTQEKLQRMNDKGAVVLEAANGGAANGNGPKVLLNGKPVAPGVAGGAAEEHHDIKQVEVQARERRTRKR